MKQLKAFRPIDAMVYNEFKNCSFWIETLNFLKKKNIKTILDIGASSGTATLMFLELPQVEKIHCFEPDKENFELLSENTKDYKQVVLYNFGIYYGTTEANVVGIGDNSPLGYMVENATEKHDYPLGTIKYKGKKFKLTTIEEVIETHIDLIKLDVEGSEYNIIENSELLKQAKYLIVSFHNHTEDYVMDFIIDSFKSKYYIIQFENSGTYSDVFMEKVK